MSATTERWAPLDAAFRAFSEQVAAPPWGSLISQTILTGPSRRALLEALGARDGWRVLDLGTGYGPIPLELAHLARLEAIGVDVDVELLSTAQGFAAVLAATGFLQSGSAVAFAAGDAYELPAASASVDLLTARLLFQHLERPGRAAAEIARVLRVGGRCLVYDVDDGLSATWPPVEGATATLDAAFEAAQRARGGDRQIGRKLASLLAAAGLSIRQLLVLPQAAFEEAGATDAAREVNERRMLAASEEMERSGLLHGRSVAELLGLAASEPVPARTRIECQIAVLAERTR